MVNYLFCNRGSVNFSLPYIKNTPHEVKCKKGQLKVGEKFVCNDGLMIWLDENALSVAKKDGRISINVFTISEPKVEKELFKKPEEKIVKSKKGSVAVDVKPSKEDDTIVVVDNIREVN